MKRRYSFQEEDIKDDDLRLPMVSKIARRDGLWPSAAWARCMRDAIKAQGLDLALAFPINYREQLALVILEEHARHEYSIYIEDIEDIFHKLNMCLCAAGDRAVLRASRLMHSRERRRLHDLKKSACLMGTCSYPECAFTPSYVLKLQQKLRKSILDDAEFMLGNVCNYEKCPMKM